MRILLDTHAFLWFAFGDDKLSSAARRAIEDPNNEAFLSLASIWEMTIKHGLGRLPLNRPIRDFVNHETSTNGFVVANVSTDHVFELLHLAPEHRDPFDRMIAAQRRVERFVLVSSDKAFDLFGVTRIWD